MSTEKIDTLVVGAGQAGIAMSEHLSRQGVPHIVLEKDRIAERWRTRRWDSLVANGPAWHDCFPGLDFPRSDADSFPSKDEITEYFEQYAEMIDAPIRTGVEVIEVKRLQGKPGFSVQTSDGDFEALRIVAATGAFQNPVIPPIAPTDSNLHQMHSADYRNPEQLPDGGVLVIGAGSSGVQIAEELMRSGRRVYLSIGAHERPPRSYRGRDFCWWLGVLGQWDLETMEPGKEHVTIAVSGAYGGHSIDFRELAQQGMTLVGLTESFTGNLVTFGDDLADNIAASDASLLSLLDAADAYIEQNGLDLPPEPEARQFPPDPDCLINPLNELNLDEENVNTIIWATGYATDYGWLQVNAFDAEGRPSHQRGSSREPGVYFLGLPWLTRRGSSFIWGVWHDAKHIAGRIANQRRYQAYHEQNQ